MGLKVFILIIRLIYLELMMYHLAVSPNTAYAFRGRAMRSYVAGSRRACHEPTAGDISASIPHSVYQDVRAYQICRI
jgi:hypothetical protein